jgi:hypothetical protein
MPDLHISKVAVGCGTLDALRERVEARREGDRVAIVTRYRPKRSDALTGGSLYWIVRHRLVARQAIVGFDERESDRRTLILLSAALIPVEMMTKRAHQGWRYLAGADAPPDLAGASGLAAMPERIAGELARLALI